SGRRPRGRAPPGPGGAMAALKRAGRARGREGGRGHGLPDALGPGDTPGVHWCTARRCTANTAAPPRGAPGDVAREERQLGRMSSENAHDEVNAAPRPGELAIALTGGGARAAYQVGLLVWLARRFPELEVPILTGVSAGAVNAG